MKKPEGTRSAMFNLGTVTKCCEFKQYVFRLDSILRKLSELLVPVTQVADAINTGVSPGKMCSGRRKAIVVLP